MARGCFEIPTSAGHVGSTHGLVVLGRAAIWIGRRTNEGNGAFGGRDLATDFVKGHAHRVSAVGKADARVRIVAALALS